MTVAHIDVWRSNPERFWAFYRDRLNIPDIYQPNAAHYALAELARRGLLHATITQNIDGLHQKAGSEDVIEMHGSVRTLVCPCGASYPREYLAGLLADNGVPYCPECARHGDPDQPLKPDVVLFGETLPDGAVERAYALAYECDLMLCIGSSLTVHPVASLPEYARHGGARLAIIAHETAYDRVASFRLTGDVAEELTGVMAAIDEPR